MIRNVLIMFSILIIISGCATVEVITFQAEEAKHVDKVSILGPEQSSPLTASITGDANMFYILMGPTIIPQIMMGFATRQANNEEADYLNDLIFDFNIEEIFREKFRHELEVNTFFKPVVESRDSDNHELMDLINKFPKSHKDYIKIADAMGTDTIIELSVYSYSLKDPGIWWDPNVILTVDARMTRPKDNKVLWQNRMTENTKRKPMGLDYMYYRENNGELLRLELEAAAEIVAKALVLDLGFEIKGGINDIREIVTEKVIETVEEYRVLYPYPGTGPGYGYGHSRGNRTTPQGFSINAGIR